MPQKHAENGTEAGKKRCPQLRTLGDLASFTARLIRETYKGELHPERAAKLGYLCSVLKGCLEASDLEERLARLEEQIATARQPGPDQRPALRAG